MLVLDETIWRSRAAAHGARVDALVAGHLERRRERVAHPVHDFLFTYYAHRPTQLRRWHPGFGVILEGGAAHYADHRAYLVGGAVDCASATVDPAFLHSQRLLLETLLRLLRATASREASFGCFGLHEWAMVYRLDDDERRHAQWPLRLDGPGTDRVVESHRITCSHFDAYRFFTDSARPLNTLSPGPGDRPEFEQPGCLHAGMDLYGKVAARLSPLIASELVAETFELAREIRVMDMRASPYDLSGLGLEPIAIETPEGKQAYAAGQRGFTERAAPLRHRLIEAVAELLRVRVSSRS